MTSPNTVAARGNRLVTGLQVTAALCFGVVGVAALLAVKFGRWPRTTLAQFVVFTATGFGAVGAVVGLFVGLTYPPTAAFAVVEIGLPAVMAGAVVGLVLGSLAVGIKRLVRYRRRLAA